MITAVSQTLAEILAVGSSLISTEQIDFNHPGMQQQGEPRINLYCYDLRENQQMQQSPLETEITPNDNNSPLWFDVSFLVTAWDCTGLGEQQLLSEALRLLLRYRFLPEKLLAPALQGYGLLPIRVSACESLDTVVFWKALAVPLRPALYVTVTVPLERQDQEFSVCNKEVITNSQKF